MCVCVCVCECINAFIYRPKFNILTDIKMVASYVVDATLYELKNERYM